jgi:hypothetical protein
VLLAAGMTIVGAGDPLAWGPREIAREGGPDSCAAVAAANGGATLDGRTGYRIKRIVGSNLTVLPEAVMEERLGEASSHARDTRRAFVVLGQAAGQPYSWRFEYDSALGVPTYEIVKGGGGRGRDAVEVHAPIGVAFRPVSDIYVDVHLICRNHGTCNVCNCCILCYCGDDSGWCDSEDTGPYDAFESIQTRHTVDLDCSLD